MKKVQKFFWLVLIFLLVIPVLAWPNSLSHASTVTGFSINGKQLLDANGNNFVMRGINHPHAWYSGQTSSFANIKATGANTVRVVIQGGARWGKNDVSDIVNVVSLCKTNKLICVLENHDTTGYGEESTAVSLAASVEYWKEIQSALTGEEAYIIINIGNEPYGNTNYVNWIAETKSAVAGMRAAGFKHTLMLDAPNWGQDWSNTMKNNATEVFNSDPDKNVIFSVHMYGVYDTAAEIQGYLDAFDTANLPLVIGEFGFDHGDGNPDEDTIMAEAQARGIGYLGWSWSGNSGGVEYLDMTTSFDPNQLTTWGQRIVNGANGIASTSVEASVYAVVSTNTPTATPTATATHTATMTPTATQRPTVKRTFHSLAWQDGWVLESSENSGQGGTRNNSWLQLRVGDDALDRQYRSILAFNTSALPDDAVIVSASLKLKQAGLIGTNPFTTHGPLRVDIWKGFAGTLPGLQLLDFAAVPHLQNAATVGATPQGGWFSAPLPQAALSFINVKTLSGGLTQFRLRFDLEDNDDLGMDMLRFLSGNSATDKPQLVIEYSVP